MQTSRRRNRSDRAWALAFATLLAAGAGAHAQSADALINKLIEKGILTTKEAEELRQETDTNFAKAYAAKSGLPPWVSSFKFHGDFRGRYERHDSDNDAFTARDRFRYRARLGFTATLFDDFEIGLRVASANPVGGFGGNPVSANTDLSDNGSRKYIWFDAAYAKWTPVHDGDWTLSTTIGKMDNPFALSPMVFDPDYQPEGLALQASYAINPKHTLRFNGAFFVLDEFNQGALASHDPNLIGGQLLWDAQWSPRFETSVTAAMLALGSSENLLNSATPNVNDGNTRTAAGAPRYNFNPFLAGASLTYKLDRAPLYKGPFPIKLAGEYLQNPGAPSRNDGWWAGLTLGKAGKQGLWEVAYKYERLEGDAIFEELPDDDFGAFYQTQLPNAGFTAPGAGYRGGTNVKGHVMKLTYNLTDYLNLAFTYYLTELIEPSPAGSESASSHYMLDLMWKF